MPQLKFQIPYSTREGHTPAVDGWTYHHILPVRYYWSAAFILLKLIRFQYCIGQGVGNIPTFAAEFGAEATQFSNETEKTDMVNMCRSLHQAGGQNVRVGLNADQSDPSNMAAIARECTAPMYGGFAGMNGSGQRLDDPGSRIETKRPLSFDPAKWTLVQELGKVLNRCITGIAAEVNGPYNCTLTEKNNEVLLHCIRELRDQWPGRTQFRCTDWKTTAGKNGWLYLTNPGPANVTPRMGQCGNVFSLVAAGEEAKAGAAVNRDELANNHNPLPIGVVRITRSLAQDDKLHFF